MSADPQSCKGGAVNEDFLKHFPAACRNVQGDLIFNQKSFDAAKKLGRCMNSVQSVEGRLVFEEIRHTANSPCLEDLRKINNNGDGPAIELNHNDGLLSLNLYSIETIKNKDRICLQVVFQKLFAFCVRSEHPVLHGKKFFCNSNFSINDSESSQEMKGVFKIHHDNFLENASYWELSRLVQAAGGNDKDCLDLFEVRQANFVGGKGKVSAYLWFFIIYGGVSVFVYGVIIVVHIFLRPHLPKQMRTPMSLKSGKSLKSFRVAMPSTPSIPLPSNFRSYN
ncbi:hypothetical protein RB195_010340 [Necator americanus]|uniref:Receptor L-domain domain-containing protein n=1 Tax=Necator americanus TaxID=51031 RepID=A0ABR1CYX9_NECAM